MSSLMTIIKSSTENKVDSTGMQVGLHQLGVKTTRDLAGPSGSRFCNLRETESKLVVNNV
jgi:hypothetical protein